MSRFLYSLTYFAYFLFLSTSCDLLSNEDKPHADNIFSDNQLKQIYQYQDQRQSDSLLAYFSDEDARYRSAAAKAFASVQDSNVWQELSLLLDDPDSLVVRDAAYALGQIGSQQALNPLMARASVGTTDIQTRFFILEAIGKCANDTALAFISGYPIEECPEGIGAGLLRASIKKVSSKKGLKIASTLISGDFSEKAKIFASTYLARSRKPELLLIADHLIHGLRHDISPFVRMNCALALGYASSNTAIDALKDAVSHDENILVQINALRGLRQQKKGFDIAVKMLNHSHAQVAYTAAQLVNQQLNASNLSQIEDLLPLVSHWRTKASLIGGLIRLKPEVYSDNALKYLQQSSSPYEKAALLNALGESPENYSFIKERLYISEHHVTRTAAIEALIKIVNHQGFKELQKKQPEITQEFAGIFQKAIESKDIGQVYTVAMELRNKEANYKSWFKELGFLKTTRDAMQLPKDVEGYQELQKTINYFEGIEEEPVIEKSSGHAIDWELIASLPQKQEVKLSTSKGDLTMELYVNEAPGTVATIVSLIKSGFYNGKAFHRVVPNFVAQGGCPRGDGFGGLEYTIRSEFSPLYYEQGSVGVASAGKDTESCQWFITHSPVPHLDGRYTIFAKVIRGMEVVQQLQMGDLIEHVSLVERE